MGNLELHLIKGTPTVTPGDAIICGHMAIEVDDMPAVVRKLKECGIVITQNVSVPNVAKGSGDRGEEEGKTKEDMAKGAMT
jgi:hypothetical protein